MIFGFSQPRFLGIDFGTSCIKAVELSVKGGKPVLENFGQVDLKNVEKDIKTGVGRSFDDEVKLHLRALLSRMKPESHTAYVALPAFIGLISLIDFPQMEGSEMEDAVRFEAHKYIPSALEDVSLSWEVVGTRKTEDGLEKMEVLLVAALNKEIERYEKYIESAELKMGFLELETFSFVRSVLGQEPGLYLLADIGSRATNLALVEDGIVKVSRNLDAGGKDMTRTIMESRNITQERAEILKQSGKDFLNNPEEAVVFPALQLIMNEIGRMLAAYKAKYPEAVCRGIVLSGGTAQFAGLTELFGKQFHLPVTVGDPWKRIGYDPKLAPAVQKLGTAFSVALGLALNGVEALTRSKTPSPDKKFSLKALLTKKI